MIGSLANTVFPAFDPACQNPVMTPTTLLERIATMGPQDTVLFHPLAGGMDPELAWRSLHLFEQQVWPQLQEVKV